MSGNSYCSQTFLSSLTLPWSSGKARDYRFVEPGSIPPLLTRYITLRKSVHRFHITCGLYMIRFVDGGQEVEFAMELPRGPIHVDAMFQNPPVYHVVSTWNLPQGNHVVCTLGIFARYPCT